MDSNCYVVIYRTTLFYIILLIVFKLMGKREIGQLTLLDLVVSVLMAEIAAMAIDNLNRPIHEVLLAIGLLGALQFSSAFITLRFKKVREIIDGKPSILIHQGRIDLDEMRRQRYTFDDLMLQLRANNISSIFEVEYAILESNGQLSSFKRDDMRLLSITYYYIWWFRKRKFIKNSKNEGMGGRRIRETGNFWN